MSYLDLLGWDPITPEFKKKFLETPRKVVIFPHTTYFDFILMALYASSEWEIYKSGVYTIVKPQLLEGPFGSFFEALNCIPATRLEEQGAGFIQRTITRFKDKATFTLLIAPTGSTRRSPWRSGYFYLAQQLQCPIQVIGLDYHRHCIMAFDPVFPTELSITQEVLQQQMAQIPPLYPENSILSSPQVVTSLCNFTLFNLGIVIVIGIGIILLMQLILPPSFIIFLVLFLAGLLFL